MSNALQRLLRPRRLGLRARITLAFTIGTTLLSVMMALITYGFARSNLLSQRDTSAVRQAEQNARFIELNLPSNPKVVDVLAQLQTPASTKPLVFYRDIWSVLTGQNAPNDLPPSLVDRVRDQSTAARMVYVLRGQPVLAIGVPILSRQGSYFEIESLTEVTSTLRSVRFSLIGASAITTALGVLLGTWVARRAVKPLADAAQAAKAIAGGRLDTRLEASDDRDLQMLASAFNGMASALEERVERDARFASDVSHELRSPLMTLAASVEVLQARREEMSERSQSALDLLVGDVARFQNLVEDLLEMSRIDAGALRLNREPLFVAEFVRHAVAVSSVRDACVKVSPHAEHLVIEGDKRRMARVVANLVDNARIHGGEPVEIAVNEDPDDPNGHVRIAVSDHGAGVPAEERTLVFQRFARGVGAGRRGLGEGTGLGLAIVEEHVKLHGGRVWVEDRADGEHGARFVIELPAEPA
jgi:signal transduction histidine kinase